MWGSTRGTPPRPRRVPRGQAPTRSAAIALALAIALGGACDDGSYRDIGGDIKVLTTRSDALVPRAIERLREHGRRALPQIEVALHTASDNGRRNLVAALGAIADSEAIPILRHLAVYDLDADVRQESEALLTKWRSGPHAFAASAALERITERRARGEVPVPIRP